MFISELLILIVQSKIVLPLISFIQQKFVKHIVCARYSAKSQWWMYCLVEASILLEEDKQCVVMYAFSFMKLWNIMLQENSKMLNRE